MKKNYYKKLMINLIQKYKIYFFLYILFQIDFTNILINNEYINDDEIDYDENEDENKVNNEY